MLLALLACAGTFTLDGTTEPVRTAMRLQVEGQPGALYWFSNTTVHCDPDDVADDPSTTEDETAQARLWWMASVGVAFSREDALDVVVWAPTAADDTFALVPWSGAFPSTGGLGAWYRVDEASSDGGAGTWYTYSVDAVTEEVLQGSVVVDGDTLSLTSTGDAPDVDTPWADCTNALLVNALYSQALQVLAGQGGVTGGVE